NLQGYRVAAACTGLRNVPSHGRAVKNLMTALDKIRGTPCAANFVRWVLETVKKTGYHRAETRLTAQFSVTQRLVSSGETLYKWGSVSRPRIIVWPNRH